MLQSLKLSSRQSKSLPPINQNHKIGQYIENSLKVIQDGCYINGKLHIDGNYGDYRMSIFRLKDRKNRQRNIPTLFNQTFIEKLNKTIYDDINQKNQIMEIINNKNYSKQLENVQSIHQEPIVPIKGQFSQIRQNDGALFYQYLPKQQFKWFQILQQSKQLQIQRAMSKLDASTILSNEMPKAKTVRKLKPKNKHLLKYQQLQKNRNMIKSFLV